MISAAELTQEPTIGDRPSHAWQTQQATEQHVCFLQSGVGNAHEAHLLDAAAVKLAHRAVLEGPLLGRALCRLRTVKQLVRIYSEIQRGWNGVSDKVQTKQMKTVNRLISPFINSTITS